MSTFENDLRLEEIGTGERAGTWGTATNVNLELIANALSYSSTGEAIPNASTHTLTMVDGAADEFRSLYLKCTGGGQACTVTLAPNTLSKVWMIENQTSATLTFTHGSGANVAVLAGQVKIIGTDGVGNAGAVFDLMQDLSVPDLFVDDDITLQSDAAVLGFGANKDVTLTHVHDAGLLLNAAMKIQFRDAALSISSSGADVLDIASDGVINLTATTDVVIPANVGLTFGTGEKIEGDSTDLTITSGAKINLTATSDVVVPANVGITFGTGEKIEGDNTDLTITSGAKINLAATSDVHLANNIGMVFGDAGEKIEGDGTNLAINSSGDVNITATTVDLDGNLEVSGSITLGSGAVIVEAELELLDGLTPGTAIATKVVTTDANIDTTGQRNLTITGDLVVGGDLTISGDDLIMATNTAGMLLIADGTNFNPTAVTSLSEISTAANDDVFLAIDTSGGGLKKITRSTVLAGTGSSTDLANVVEDTTPQLGGNLDMNGKDIVTLSNATIDLAPHGTGTVVVRGNTNSAAIVFNCESNSHGQTVQAQPHSASATNTMLLPEGSSSTLLSRVSTDTLTNKTLTSPKINENVAVTSTATELNLLDGVTSTTAELNILDGVTSTAAELNILDGVTSDAAELNILDGVTSTTAELNILDGVTSTTAELNILDGVTSTAAELNILDGVTSTAAELNILDGATVVVGEINALDLGSTAVGTAIASKAVILDSNKDYTGIRNLTIAGTLTQTGVATFAAVPIANAGLSVKNGSTSGGFVSFFEDSSDGASSVKLIAPALAGDVSVTLPTAAGILATIDDATALSIALS